MELYHVHLETTDVAAAQAFYEHYFGFRRCFPDAPEVFLKDDRGFLIALAKLMRPEPIPAWFHLGFQGAGADEVRALHARMAAEGVVMAEPWAEFPSGTVKFHCFDPSGYRIEVRWDATG